MTKDVKPNSSSDIAIFIDPIHFRECVLKTMFSFVEALSLQFESSESDELKESKRERLNLGHSIDKILLTVSAATLGFVLSTYGNTEFTGNEAMRLTALLLIFSSLAFSYANLLCASRSFDLDVSIRTLIEKAKHQVPNPYSGSNQIEEVVVNRVFDIIDFHTPLADLKRKSIALRSLRDKSSPCAEDLDRILPLYNDLETAFKRLKSNPWNGRTENCLNAAILAQLAGIIALLLSFLMK